MTIADIAENEMASARMYFINPSLTKNSRNC